MRIFISWSGNVSHQVAVVLREWLPQVIQAVDPFVSSKDIEKGDRWDSAIARELAACSEGLVVVTAQNKDRPWLNFEAGAISKQQEIARVRTLLFDISATEVTGPLSSFQSTNIQDYSDVSQLMTDLAKSCSPPLADRLVEKALERCWTDLQASLNKVDAPAGKRPTRTTVDILSEVLDRVRHMDQRVSSYGEQINRLATRLGDLELGVPVIASVQGSTERLRPGQIRVYDLAKELGVESKTVLSTCKDLGEFVRSASSRLEAPVARRVRELLQQSSGA